MARKKPAQALAAAILDLEVPDSDGIYKTLRYDHMPIYAELCKALPHAKILSNKRLFGEPGKGPSSFHARLDAERFGHFESFTYNNSYEHLIAGLKRVDGDPSITAGVQLTEEEKNGLLSVPYLMDCMAQYYTMLANRYDRIALSQSDHPKWEEMMEKVTSGEVRALRTELVPKIEKAKIQGEQLIRKLKITEPPPPPPLSWGKVSW